MKPSVTIIDYGAGNILSITKAFEHCGAKVNIADFFFFFKKDKRLILPGVGGFEDGMLGLKKRGFIEPIKSLVDKGKPVMGICLGMQMLLEISEEFGTHKGLGFIPGKAVSLPKKDKNGESIKTPSIGWYKVYNINYKEAWENTILEGVSVESHFYFAHSFYAAPSKDEYRLANYNFNSHNITAVVRARLLYGCQFHPEKSGEAGLTVIRNFLNI
jgi:glutamine amidotransferase